jgi:Carboxymuconolactone decarboxylase family
MTLAPESTASSTAPATPGITDYQTPAQQMIGQFAPKLAELTDEVLFGDVWARPQLSPRDRSLITCAALVTNGSIEQRGRLQVTDERVLTDIRVTVQGPVPRLAVSYLSIVSARGARHITPG